MEEPRKTTYKLILAPEKAIVPDDLTYQVVAGSDIVAKIAAGAEQPVVIPVNVRELQFLVEYRDLFPAEVRAIIGLPGAMYNTIWNTYVSTMTRVTVDDLRAELREGNNARADAGQHPASDPVTRRRGRALNVVPPTEEDLADDSVDDIE
jgi:hypothetical protein